MQKGMASQDMEASSGMSETFGSSENGVASGNDEAFTDLLGAAWDGLSFAFWLSEEINSSRSLTEYDSCADQYTMGEQRTTIAAKRAQSPRTRL
jgi:hypothetical protein